MSCYNIYHFLLSLLLQSVLVILAPVLFFHIWTSKFLPYLMALKIPDKIITPKLSINPQRQLLGYDPSEFHGWHVKWRRNQHSNL